MDNARDTIRILIRDLRLYMSVGIYDHEMTRPQEVLVNIEAEIVPPAGPTHGHMAGWVSYEDTVRTVQNLAARGHVKLLETFAEHIADSLMQDGRITSVSIRLEKTNAIPETFSVGVALTRVRKNVA